MPLKCEWVDSHFVDPLILMLFVAAIMHADTSGFRAIVRTGFAAIEFAIAQDSLAGWDHAVTAQTGALNRFKHGGLL